MRRLACCALFILLACGGGITDEELQRDTASDSVCIVGETAECCTKNGVTSCEGDPE